MHRQETHDDITEVDPALLMCIVIDIDFDLIWKVLIGYFSLAVFNRLYFDDLISLDVLDIDGLDVMSNFSD